jgi:hypothetical protein
MPRCYKLRNQAIVHLFRLGWSKYSIAKLFQKHGGWKKAGIYLVLRRDIEKYPLPPIETIKKIQEELVQLFGNKKEIISKIENN